MKPNKDITWFCSLFVIVYRVLPGILKRILIVIILKNRKLVRMRQQQDQQTGTKLCTDIINFILSSLFIFACRQQTDCFRHLDKTSQMLCFGLRLSPGTEEENTLELFHTLLWQLSMCVSFVCLALPKFANRFPTLMSHLT